MRQVPYWIQPEQKPFSKLVAGSEFPMELAISSPLNIVWPDLRCPVFADTASVAVDSKEISTNWTIGKG